MSNALSSQIPLQPKDLESSSKLLETAFADGRLSMAEFEMRMSELMKAKSHRDVQLLIFDLHSSSPEMLTPRTFVEKSRAIFSGIEQKGSFRLAPHLEMSAIFGGYVLDLSKAELSTRHSIIDIRAIFGGVQIIAPKGVRILVKGFPIFGGISNQTSEDYLDKDAPIIEINARCIFGGVDIAYPREKSFTYSW